MRRVERFRSLTVASSPLATLRRANPAPKALLLAGRIAAQVERLEVAHVPGPPHERVEVPQQLVRKEELRDELLMRKIDIDKHIRPSVDRLQARAPLKMAEGPQLVERHERAPQIRKSREGTLRNLLQSRVVENQLFDVVAANARRSPGKGPRRRSDVSSLRTQEIQFFCGVILSHSIARIVEWWAQLAPN
jgi:hypothetical protein